MATRSARTPQQRDARELARTPQANPYRGTMLDPFAAKPLPVPQPAATVTERAATTERPASQPTRPGVDRPASWTSTATPTPAIIAGILGFVLSIALVLFGVSLFALLSLQSDLGAPDRSFYRGADSGSVVLALLNFALAGGCAVGAILFLGGRVVGRVSCTISGWLILCLSAFWYLRGHSHVIALVVALLAAAMLLLSYQRSVTRWLGVLLPAQPD